MEPRCNYFWKPSENLTIVIAVEHVSGPPFIQKACVGRMVDQGMKPWRS